MTSKNILWIALAAAGAGLLWYLLRRREGGGGGGIMVGPAQGQGEQIFTGGWGATTPTPQPSVPDSALNAPPAPLERPVVARSEYSLSPTGITKEIESHGFTPGRSTWNADTPPAPPAYQSSPARKIMASSIQADPTVTAIGGEGISPMSGPKRAPLGAPVSGARSPSVSFKASSAGLMSGSLSAPLQPTSGTMVTPPSVSFGTGFRSAVAPAPAPSGLAAAAFRNTGAASSALGKIGAFGKATPPPVQRASLGSIGGFRR